MRYVGDEATRIQVATLIADILIHDYKVNGWRRIHGFPEVIVSENDHTFDVTLRIGTHTSRTISLDCKDARDQAAARESGLECRAGLFKQIQNLMVDLESSDVDLPEEVAND
ncbi:hypothetical protein ACJJIU_03585 [Microbulbifer sp. CnH-101-E]|uniref:hypothetical protein n=1 Tax=unclassified Microbulbifer TaxID=2619833 RepID=UPI0040392E91